MATTLKEKIYLSLREKILAGEIKPGEYLMEKTLASMFSVSRTPVREALNLVYKDGLIDTLPNNGFMVKQLDFKDVMDLLFVRLFLEEGAAYMAANKITDQDIDELERLIQYPDEESIIDYNNNFHLLIARASGNERLFDLIKNVLEEIDWVLSFDPSTKIEEDDIEHIAIIKALKKRDGASATNAMKDHLVKTIKRIQVRLSNNYLGDYGLQLNTYEERF